MEVKDYEKILTNASNTLKDEFVGLDEVIDQLINFVRPWYMFNDLITKPVIVNLWGLTGVGKTHLVHRLTELIDRDDDLFDIDMAEYSDWNVEYRLQKGIRSLDDKSKILVLDEFQLGRTIDEYGAEVTEGKTGGRRIWQLIDTGKIQTDWNGGRVSDTIDTLRAALSPNSPVVIENNQVESEIAYNYGLNRTPIGMSSVVRSKTIRMDKLKPGHSYVLGITSILDLYMLMNPESNKWKSVHDFAKDVNTWGTEEFRDFIYDTEFKSPSTEMIDLSKSLIFVIGNLDEVYTMHDDFNPDINADEFHKLSKDITITDVKNALSKRFRSEQIARLGNNHIIYPALSDDNFKDLIYRMIRRYENSVAEKLGIKNLHIDEKLRELIYTEGVYPTQGVRPVQSSFYDIVECALLRSISYIASEYPNVEYEDINMSYSEAGGHILTVFNKDGFTVGSFSFPYKSTLAQLRAPKEDDMQALTAVHESGHAIVHTVVNSCLPNQVRSVSSGSGMEGFTEYKVEGRSTLTRFEVITQAATAMAGLIAEEIIFGADSKTRGAKSDLCKATNIVGDAVTKWGLFSGRNNLPMGVFTEDSKYIEEKSTFLNLSKDFSYPHNLVIKGALNAAESLARSILNENKELLLRMADYLSDHSVMNSEMVRDMFEKYYNFCNMYRVYEPTILSEDHEIKLNLTDLYTEVNKNKFRLILKDEIYKLDGKN